MDSPILAPAITLVLWSLVMLAWLAAVRFPAMHAAGIELTSLIGSRGSDLHGVVPDEVNWPAHNYAHLMEQPTIFYATVFVLALAGAGDGVNLALAWAYVLVRVVHSLVQALWNRVAVRFALFCVSTAALLLLAVRAAWTVLL